MCMSVVQESRALLAERDEELTKLRLELDHYKQQAAKEIANKTKLAQALDESHRHARELEELLQQWQLEVSQLKMYCVVTYNLYIAQPQHLMSTCSLPLAVSWCTCDTVVHDIVVVYA